jgi:hypothetical protein
MSRTIAIRILAVSCICFGAGYPFYCWVAQAGLFLWFSYLELTIQGKGPYTVHASLIMIPTLVLAWVAVYFIYQPTAWLINRLLPAPPVIINEAPTPAPAPAPVDGKAKRNPVVVSLFVFSVLLIAVGVSAGVVGYLKTPKSVTYAVLNLAGGALPNSKYVKLTGMAVPSLKSQYRVEIRSSYDVETYIPVVQPNWRQGDPVVYFLHPFHDSYGNAGPVMVAQTGVLIPDALPGAAAFICRKHGLTLAQPTFVLEHDPQADMDPYLYTTAYCTIIGLCLFFPFALAGIGTFFGRNKSSS